jgi:hypothetical protein
MKSLNAETKEMGMPYLLGKRLEGIKCNSAGIDIAAIDYEKQIFLIAVNFSGDKISAEFDVGAIKKTREATVKSESRKASIQNGIMQDKFLPYDVHIYIFECLQVLSVFAVMDFAPRKKPLPKLQKELLQSMASWMRNVGKKRPSIRTFWISRQKKQQTGKQNLHFVSMMKTFILASVANRLTHIRLSHLQISGKAT